MRAILTTAVLVAALAFPTTTAFATEDRSDFFSDLAALSRGASSISVVGGSTYYPKIPRSGVAIMIEALEGAPFYLSDVIWNGDLPNQIGFDEQYPIRSIAFPGYVSVTVEGPCTADTPSMVIYPNENGYDQIIYACP